MQINSDIQKLRAVAVLITVFGHLPTSLFERDNSLTQVIKQLFLGSGVDIFFCISGFLVCSQLLRALERHPENTAEQLKALRNFWIKRAFRLLPAAWFWMFYPLLGVMVFSRTDLFGEIPTISKSILAIFFYIANFSQAFSSPLGANGSYWSLSLEEQFYFVFPVFLILVKSSYRIAALGVLLCLLPFLAQFPSYSLWRLDGIVLGVMLAFLVRTKNHCYFEPSFLRSKLASFLFPCMLIFGIVAVPGYFASIPFIKFIVGLLAFVLVFIATFDANYLFNNRWISKLLVWVGDRSYSMYLTNMPSFLTAKALWSGFSPNIFQLSFTALLLTLFFTELSFRYLETPFRRKYKLMFPHT